MNQTLREETPIEVLERAVKNIILTYEDDKEIIRNIGETIEKTKNYEHEYYNNQYTVIGAQLKEVQREVEVLKTQNRVLAEYITMKENCK